MWIFLLLQFIRQGEQIAFIDFFPPSEASVGLQYIKDFEKRW